MAADPLADVIRRAGDEWVALWPKGVSCRDYTADAVRAHIAANYVTKDEAANELAELSEEWKQRIAAVLDAEEENAEITSYVVAYKEQILGRLRATLLGDDRG